MTASETMQSLVSGLILLERDAIGAYVRIVDRLEDAGARQEIGRFLQNRHRRLAELTKMVLRLRFGAPRECDATTYLTTRRATLGGLVGDGALLKAMAAGESETVAAYERASTHPEALPEHRAVFEQALRDALQHSSWTEQAAHTWRGSGSAPLPAP